MTHAAENAATTLRLPARPLPPQLQPRTHRPAYCERQSRGRLPATAETRTPRTPLPARASTPACAPSVGDGIQPNVRSAAADVSAKASFLQRLFALLRS